MLFFVRLCSPATVSEISKFIGKRIRNYRTQQKLSQEKLAELSDCHPTYIRQSAREEKNATPESIEKISTAFGVPLSKLLEKLDESSSDESIPLKCYEFLSTKSVDDQEHLYQLLLDLDHYKNK